MFGQSNGVRPGLKILQQVLQLIRPDGPFSKIAPLLVSGGTPQTLLTSAHCLSGWHDGAPVQLLLQNKSKSIEIHKT